MPISLRRFRIILSVASVYGCDSPITPPVISPTDNPVNPFNPIMFVPTRANVNMSNKNPNAYEVFLSMITNPFSSITSDNDI